MSEVVGALYLSFPPPLLANLSASCSQVSVFKKRLLAAWVSQVGRKPMLRGEPNMTRHLPCATGATKILRFSENPPESPLVRKW